MCTRPAVQHNNIRVHYSVLQCTQKEENRGARQEIQTEHPRKIMSTEKVHGAAEIKETESKRAAESAEGFSVTYNIKSISHDKRTRGIIPIRKSVL